MTDIVKWKPPSWWAADNNFDIIPTKDLVTYSCFGVLYGDRVRRVRSAYARAKKCKVCYNNEWPTLPGGVFVGSLLSSAGKGCAGCLTLCGIVNKSGLISKSSSQPFELGWEQWVSCRVERSRLVLECYPKASWEVFDPKGREHPWRIPHLPDEVVADSGSDEAVQRTSSWLQDCDDNHELCKGANLSLPTRVVLIQGPKTIKLYDLSQSLLGESKAFQDAISFAFRLGYKYLWIDSLCIIQDSREDWRNEGSKMAQIYPGADFTIAATVSSIPSEGCFRQTTERPMNMFSYPDTDGSMLDVCVRASINQYAWRYGDYPLLRRGWTLQECLLSRRLLHFTAEEMFWSCRTVNKCECSFWWDAMTLPFRNLRSPKYLTTISSSNEEECTALWHGIVSEYTSSSLTYETDCFPALQGVSNQLYPLKRSAYMAGLWESSIMHDLLWYSDPKSKASKPTGWRAQSWSWASVVGRVMWPQWISICTPLSTYTGKDIVLAGQDEYGEISAATITLRGSFLLHNVEGTCDYYAPPDAAIAYPDHRAWRKCPRRILLDRGLALDLDLEDLDSKKYVALIGQVKTLLMGVYQMGAEGYLYGTLVLRPVDAAADTFERIGFMEFETRKGYQISDLPLGDEETLHVV